MNVLSGATLGQPLTNVGVISVGPGVVVPQFTNRPWRLKLRRECSFGVDGCGKKQDECANGWAIIEEIVAQKEEENRANDNVRQSVTVNGEK